MWYIKTYRFNTKNKLQKKNAHALSFFWLTSYDNGNLWRILDF